MKIEHTNDFSVQSKIPATEITIKLGSLEAGWLRQLLSTHPSLKSGPGFGVELFRELDRFHFEDYEKRYPCRREEPNIPENENNEDNKLRLENVKLRNELENYNKSSKLYDESIHALTKVWRAENLSKDPLSEYLPDTANLVKWAADKIKELTGYPPYFLEDWEEEEEDA